MKATSISPAAATAAAKSLQSCPTLCDPIDSSPSGSTIPGIIQARTLERVAISFSNAWKWKVKVKSLSHVRLPATPWTAAHQVPPSMGFSGQEYWSGVPLPSPPSILIFPQITFFFLELIYSQTFHLHLANPLHQHLQGRMMNRVPPTHLQGDPSLQTAGGNYHSLFSVFSLLNTGGIHCDHLFFSEDFRFFSNTAGCWLSSVSWIPVLSLLL